MKNYSLSQIREVFLDYFTKRGHEHVKSSSLIPHNDDSLLFTNAGMVQFKNVFLGLEQKPYNQAVSVQKCLRAGGKHNDLDNVGYTARHHTFFEMLGNFSFGGYFKEQAIYYAYDFISNVLGIDKSKLLVTVYSEDQETAQLWKKIAGFPDNKIIRISTNDNFWSMGDTGPSGPCTEIFYDLGDLVPGSPPGTPDADGDRFIEIWNLVFMQYNQLGEGQTELLRNPAVDTGMGLERIAAVMQGVLDNYDTDLFQAIIGAFQDILSIKVSSTNKPSFKVLADHIRAAVFLINDGVLPSNEGRGYVLRRIIRRAIRHGYLLGNKEPFLYQVVPLITTLMGGAYPELNSTLNFTQTTIYSEEEKFNKTIEEGMRLLLKSKNLVTNNVLPGDIAFKLYDTYGFPLDLTESILQQDNIRVDLEQFEMKMNQQKQLSKEHWVGSGELKEHECWFKLKESITTKFNGYTQLSEISRPVALVSTDFNLQESLNTGEEGYVLFHTTPFYPEGGGQVGDKGIIAAVVDPHDDLSRLDNTSTHLLWSFYYHLQQHATEYQTVNTLDIAQYAIEEALFNTLKAKIIFFAEVIDTIKVANDLIVHKIKVLYGSFTKNDCILLVNQELRHRAAANHTATHILFQALKTVLGYEVKQQGSLVTPSRLRADVFLNNPLTEAQLKAVETEANKYIVNNLPVYISYMDYQQAIDKGAHYLMGENYPDIVRVVTIGEDDNFYSRELCGGCHVQYTGEIGLFKIMSESSIRSGVRRLEVVTRQAALQVFQNLDHEVNAIYNSLKANKNNVFDKINHLLDENKALSKRLENLEQTSFVQALEQNLKKTGNLNHIMLTVSSNLFNKIRNTVNSIVKRYQPIIVCIVSENKDVQSFLIMTSNDLKNQINLLQIIQDLKEHTSEVKGGGNAHCIQGSLNIKDKKLLEQLVKNIIHNQ